MTNLVVTFIEVSTSEPGVTLADAVRTLNSALGSSHRHSRFRAWERGERVPGPSVINYMLKAVLPVELAKAGVDPKKIDSIVQRCLLAGVD